MTSNAAWQALPPLGLVLRTGVGAPTQAEVLAFDPLAAGAAPLATFDVAPPDAVEVAYRVTGPGQLADWISAHPTSPVSRMARSGVQAFYPTQAARDAALVAARQDPDVAGVFTPSPVGYWTFPETPLAQEPFGLFAAYYQCEGLRWWGLTPVPYELNVTSSPIRLVSPGENSICGVPPPPFRQVWGWHLPGLSAGEHTIDLYRLHGTGVSGPVESLVVGIAPGAGLAQGGPQAIPASGFAFEVALVIACCAAGLFARWHDTARAARGSGGSGRS